MKTNAKKPNLQFLLTTSKIENVYALETGKFRFDSRILRFSDYNEPSKILGFVLRSGSHAIYDCTQPAPRIQLLNQCPEF